MSKKRRQELEYEEEYEFILNEIKKSRIPALTLNKDWHDVFKHNKSKEMVRLEKELNDMLKSQGRVNQKNKELVGLKKQLLLKIQNNMDAGENSKADKEIAKCKELIEDINDKIKGLEDEDAELPYKMRETNAMLAMESMERLCTKTVENSETLEGIDEEIEGLKKTLKEKMAIRSQLEEENKAIRGFLGKTIGKNIVRHFENMLKKYG